MRLYEAVNWLKNIALTALAKVIVTLP